MDGLQLILEVNLNHYNHSDMLTTAFMLVDS